MGRAIFNSLELGKAISLKNTNPNEAKIRFETYLKNYPRDYSAYIHYITFLIALGILDEAEKLLDYAESSCEKDQKVINRPDKMTYFKSNFLRCKLQLLSFQERYEELYQLCMKNLKSIEKIEVVYYAKKKSGRLNISDRGDNSYLIRQIIEYSEDDFLEHTKKHMANYRINERLSVFDPTFPFKQVIAEIKKYIPSDKKRYNSYYHDCYIFRYDGCGRSNNRTVNYFKIICFHNTSDIITMHPVDDNDNLPYVNLNYMIKEDNNPKIRRKSQIDKFNQRYKNTRE